MLDLLDFLKMGAGIAAGILIYHVYNVAIDNPSVEREARAGYVLLVEKQAAEAQAAEMIRQRNASAQSLEEYRKRLSASRQAERQAQDTLEQEIASYELQLSEKNRACLADDADVQFLQPHR
ncbi:MULTISPECIES: hypothetical protein [unclassified Sinorhizobium]|uniref:hypothetical protein n=1 Tax=unclassified Sinorhizobium TaxID=2613772 RepID=UPI0035256083